MGKSDELTEADLRVKISNYCAYQERSPEQVLQKLNTLSKDRELISSVFSWATNENYVSETRFAEVYTHGKFHLKKWGKIKIRQGLIGHKIAEDIIEEALQTLEVDEYCDALISLGKKKYNETQKENNWILTKRYLLGKGYESYLIDKLSKRIKDD